MNKCLLKRRWIESERNALVTVRLPVGTVHSCSNISKHAVCLAKWAHRTAAAVLPRRPGHVGTTGKYTLLSRVSFVFATGRLVIVFECWLLVYETTRHIRLYHQVLTEKFEVLTTGSRRSRFEFLTVPQWTTPNFGRRRFTTDFVHSRCFLRKFCLCYD